MFFHASSVEGIKRLEPRVSNHGIPLIYFSEKRENVLVYLSNAVEKYCRETNFEYNGTWHKWGSYGFTQDGILRLEEYYPNAAADTYEGVSAYIYSVSAIAGAKKLDGIPFACTSDRPVDVENCEYVPDAYEAIRQAVGEGKMILEKYEELSPQKKKWIEKTVMQEYHDSRITEDYQHFLAGKFGL